MSGISVVEEFCRLSASKLRMLVIRFRSTMSMLGLAAISLLQGRPVSRDGRSDTAVSTIGENLSLFPHISEVFAARGPALLGTRGESGSTVF
jgi:hypothetical protein